MAIRITSKIIQSKIDTLKELTGLHYSYYSAYGNLHELHQILEHGGVKVIYSADSIKELKAYLSGFINGLEFIFKGVDNKEELKELITSYKEQKELEKSINEKGLRKSISI